eukprot:scaffold295185_cov86-Cyclotella_meneghiniana.AAC.1
MLVDHPSTLIEIPNPMHSCELAGYLNEWIPSIPSWNSSILHVCQLEVVATVDNSNGISESNFKIRNEDTEYKASTCDPGVHIKHRWYNSILQAKSLIHDIESICNFAEVKRAKKKRGLEMTNELERKVKEEDEREQIWRKSNPMKTKMNKLRDELRTLLDIDDLRVSQLDRYNRVKAFLEKVDALVNDKGDVVVTQRTLHNWLSLESDLPKFLRLKKTREGLEEFAKILTDQMSNTLGQPDDYSMFGQVDINTVSLLKCDGGYREVIEVARSLRQLDEYSLLPHPEERMLPTRFRDEIKNFIASIITNPSVGKEVVSVEHTPIASMHLNERHLDGEKVEFGTGAKIATDRLLVGINMQATEDQLYFCSRYSLSLVATPSPIKDMVSASIPTEIFTRHGDTKESLAERYNACEWLDPIHVHRQGETLVNGDPNY